MTLFWKRLRLIGAFRKDLWFPARIKGNRFVARKEASNIPVRKTNGQRQKPAILTTSSSSLPTPLLKSWSFWVFVQILGFSCGPMRASEKDECLEER